MKNNLLKFREAIALLTGAVVVALLVWLVILPLMVRINEVKDQIQEENLNQEITQRHMNELPKIEQQFAVLKQDSDQMDVLLDKNKAVELIKRLEQIADQTSVTIAIDVQEQAVKAGAAAKPQTSDNTVVGNLPSGNYLQLKMTLGGNYDEIRSFIQALENLEYYNDILDINIKKDNGVSAALSVMANPFDSANAGNAAKVAVKQNQDPNKLSAVINVVFYTK